MKIESIIEKLNSKKKLTKEELDYTVVNYTNGLINDKEMGEFLKIVKENGLSYEETFYLTESMINTGEILDLSNIEKTVVDKHSTGGVGDKVSLLVGPIVASCNLGVAKMSGRSLGFTGGTIDKLESIPGFTINLENEDFERTVNEHGICIISATKNLAPADKKIYALRDEINAVESIPLIASSIMSKKIASGAKFIVIDLKVGEGAFMKNIEEASSLAEYMIKIGSYFKRKVVCVLTDMNSPLGFTVGNGIEVKEAEEFFNGKREKRLEKLVIELSSHMVSIGKNIKLEDARREVINSLNNSSAKNKFYEWISAQNGNLGKLSLAKNKLTFLAPKDGYITKIDPLKTAKLLYDLGAGRLKKEDKIDLEVGIEFIHTLYEKVEENTPLINIYFNKKIENLEERVKELIKIESILKDEKDIIISVIK